MPVLMLTARDTLADKIRAFELGADDFLMKPFEQAELAARCRALIRRASLAPSGIVRLGRLTIDLNGHQLQVDEQAVELTRREWLVLESLAHNLGRIVSKERLMQALAGWEQDLTANARRDTCLAPARQARRRRRHPRHPRPRLPPGRGRWRADMTAPAVMTIRRRLLLMLLPALALLMLIGGVVDYRVAVATTRNAYDRALASTALALAADVRLEDGQLRFERTDAGGALAGRHAVCRCHGGRPAGFGPGAADTGPAPLLQGAEHASYHDAQLQGQSWRVAEVIASSPAGPLRIAVAETQARRAHTQQVMLLGKLLVDFAELDLTLLLVWAAVYYGLRPLDTLAAQVEEQSPRQLQQLR